MVGHGASPSARRVVVGAGMSGLAYAWWCAQAGDDVLLLDARTRAGGVVRTEAKDGYRFERAATSIPSGAVHLMALLEAVPDPPTLRPAEAASRQFIFRRGGIQPVPRSPSGLLRSRVVRPRTALRALGEVLRGPRRVAAGARRESLQAFVRRRFGQGVAEGLLRPFTSGVYGAAPERLGAADAFPSLVAWERRRGSVLRALIAGRQPGRPRRQVLVAARGTASIPQAVARALGGRLRLGCAVEQLLPGGCEDPAALVLSSGERIEADEVVLAVPARAQARLLQDSHPHLAETLVAIDYPPIVVVAVGFRRERGPEVPAGFGFLRGPGAKARILGATFNAHMNPAVAPEGAELLTVFVGGSEDRGALELDDQALRDVVLADLRAALGGRVRPELFEAWRWPRAIPMPAPGHRGRVARMAAELSSARVRLLGSHVTGVSLSDCCRPLAPPRRSLPQGLVRVR